MIPTSTSMRILRGETRVAAGAFALLAATVIPGLVAQWLHDPNYSYALFVPLMAAWVARRRMAYWCDLPRGSSRAGVAVAAVGVAVHLAGVAAAEHYTARMGVLIAGVGLVAAFEGLARARTLAAPFVLLALAIPLPYVVYYRLTFPLQLLSSRITGALLSGAGMPVVRSGNVLHLEAYTLEVVTACSGLRSTMTLVAVAVWLGAMLRLPAGARLALAALAVPVALAVNVARLVSTAALATLVGAGAADGFLHGASGVVVFLMGFGVLAGLAWGMAWREARARRQPR